MFLGGLVVTLVFMGSVWAGENKAMVKNFKKKNPTLFVVGVMVTSYFLLSLCGGVMVFIFGITFPLLRKCVSQGCLLIFIKGIRKLSPKTTAYKPYNLPSLLEVLSEFHVFKCLIVYI